MCPFRTSVTARLPPVSTALQRKPMWTSFLGNQYDLTDMLTRAVFLFFHDSH